MVDYTNGDTSNNAVDDFLNLPASTGKNDSSSVWGSGLLSGLGSLSTGAANVLTAIKGQPKKKATAIPAWAYLAIGGVALLLFVGVLFRSARA